MLGEVNYLHILLPGNVINMDQIMALQTRPKIPSPIQRAVRQKCKFCCIMCGHWIYEIDHIQEWSDVHEHDEDNLICLCPNHHSKKTKKFLSAAKAKDFLQKRATESLPFTAKDTQLVEPDTVILGSNIINGFHANSGDVFKILTDSYLSVRKLPGEIYRINCCILDNDGNPTLVIEENEMVIGTHFWDIEQTGCKLIFRNAPRDIFMSIELNAEENRIVVQGKFDICLPHPIVINERGIYLGKIVLLKYNRIHACRDGIIINELYEKHRCLASNNGNYTAVCSSSRVKESDAGLMNTIGGFNNDIIKCNTAIIYDLPTLKYLSDEHDQVVKVQAAMYEKHIVA